MPARPETKPRRLPYWISFTAFTLVLGGLTVAFVLGVLRQRFVLHAGLRESGVSFPTGPTPFTVQERAMVRPSLAILLPPDVESEARPGPSEAFWGSVLPLLREERYPESFAIFSEYLKRFPADQAVRREYAVALARAGRLADSEAAFLRVVAATDDAAVRLELARLQRDRRAFGRSVATYRQLLVERPEDPRLRRELARTLAWAERYEEAIAEYDALLTLEPERSEFLLEYARVLFWAQRLEAAQRVLAELPEDSPDLDAAGTLTAQIAALLAVPEPGAAP
ncbi:MAG: tetratricopeptide repeat protein, partial [Gemmatimonadota bacterium]